MGRLAAALVAALSAALLAGCISWSEPGTAQPAPVPSQPMRTPTVFPGAFAYGSCFTASEATAFSVRARTGTIGGAMLGEGKAAVVFVNMTGRDGCDWAPVAREVVARGHRAVVWSYGSAQGLDQLAELTAVVAETRRRGAERVLLAGASRGGCLAMMASTQLTPRVAGVAIVSCAGVFNRSEPVRTEPWAAQVSVPVLHITAEQDPVPSVAEARADLAVMPVQDKTLVVVPSVATHGIDLLKADQPRTTLLAFIDRLLAAPGR